ncbi:hypothetical protein Tco_0605721 [Tanacetum coccineum]
MYTFPPMMVANSRKHHCRVRPYTREVLVISTNLDLQKNHYRLDFTNRRGVEARIKNTWLVPSCFAIFDLEPLTLSLDFVLMYEIFKSLSFRLDRLCRLAILCLDQHAHTLHHLESLLTISLDRLDILKEDLVYQSLCGSLCL